MSTIHITADEYMTATLARMLAATARPGRVFLLDGPVGAGKTHFARAFIRARQGEAAEDVPSPTFTLVQTYDDPMGTEIWHADLYRLTDPSELDELGLEEAQESAICLIEWPDRLEVLPEGAVTIAFSNHENPDMRQIALTGQDTRTALCAEFLHRNGWGDAQILPLAGDASARRYFRLNGSNGPALLMDDPSGDVARFITVTDWLHGFGFAAPEIYAKDPENGLLLIEDFGDDLVNLVLEKHPEKTAEIYRRITDFLVELRPLPVPDFVTQLNADLLAEQVGLFAEWYPQATGAETNAADDIGPLIARLHQELAEDIPAIFCMRDFQSPNILWRGEGIPLGLIDYQDAVACHPAYDLVSVLQDPRREVAPETEADCVARYLAATGLSETRFHAAYALLGAQRNLRIMGIFTRLCIRDGKPHYLDFMPRVWRYLRRDLSHPALAPLARIVDALPEPDPQTIERIRRQCDRP